MASIDHVRGAVVAFLSSVALIGGGPAHSAAPAAAPVNAAPPTPASATTTAPMATATAPSQVVPGAPPPLAPELPPANPAGMPAMNAGEPAATTVPAESFPPATVPGRMSPTAPMVQPATPPATPAPAPSPTTSAATAAVSSAGSLTQVALVLLLVIGLIAGAAWLLKRLGMARNPGGTMVRIVSGVSLSNRERILVVEVADQWIVVGVAPGCINTLATMPRQQSAAVNAGAGMPTPAGSNFALWLKQTMDKRSGTGSGNGTGNDK